MSHGAVLGVYIELSSTYEPYLLDEYYCDNVLVRWKTNPQLTDVIAVTEDEPDLNEFNFKCAKKWNTVCITDALAYTFRNLV